MTSQMKMNSQTNGAQKTNERENISGFSRTSRTSASDVGQIGAGKSIDFLPNSKKVWVTRPAAARANDKLVRVIVSGDSLIEDDIRNGDFLICRTNFEFSEIRNGSLIVAKLPSGELTIKKFYLNNDNTVTLRAANSHYKDQTFKPHEIEIQAVALELNRSL